MSEVIQGQEEQAAPACHGAYYDACMALGLALNFGEKLDAVVRARHVGKVGEAAKTYQQAHAQGMAAVRAYMAETLRDSGDMPAPSAPEQSAPAGRTLDQLADDALNRVAAFIGECVSAESFCGLAVDEMRDEDGKLLSLRLVPCDLVADESVRRVGK